MLTTYRLLCEPTSAEHIQQMLVGALSFGAALDLLTLIEAQGLRCTQITQGPPARCACGTKRRLAVGEIRPHWRKE